MAMYVFSIQSKAHQTFPLYTSYVAAGFPSPADDHLDQSLNLHDYLVEHPAATFFVRVEGDSMIGAGIHHGDMLVVDRALTPVDGKIVIAVVEGELTVKRLQKRGNKVLLVPENEAYPTIEIVDGIELTIWGVVTSVIRKV